MMGHGLNGAASTTCPLSNHKTAAERLYLKDDVAEITTDMTDENPKIRHFTKLNPSWQQGTELPCVGEVSVHMMWSFMRKNMRLSKKKKDLMMEPS